MNKIWQIYKATGKCGRAYVGVTTQGYPKRWRSHISAAACGEKSALYNAIRKYGSDWFTVELLCECYSIKEAKITERALICAHNTYVRNGNGFNVTLGGDGAWGLKFSDEAKAAISRKSREFMEKNPEHVTKMVSAYNAMGRPISDKGRESRVRNGKMLGALAKTPEYRAKISNTLTGVKQEPGRAAKSANSLKINSVNAFTPENLAKRKESQKRTFADPVRAAEIRHRQWAERQYEKALAARIGYNRPYRYNGEYTEKRAKAQREVLKKLDLNREDIQRRKRIDREYQKALAARIGYPRPYSCRKDKGTTKKPHTQATKDKISATKMANRAARLAMRVA